LRLTEKHIAILIFTLSEEEELQKKPFLKKYALEQKLTTHTLNIVQKTGLDYYVYSEQKGNSFGERFTNAISDIYDKGYDAIITLGNDTPSLNTTHLYKTIQALQQGQSVIGPSFDGGFYLMGIHKENYQAEKFIEFSWNTSHVRKELCSYFEANHTAYLQLEFLYDLDHVTDTKDVYKTLPYLYKKIKLALQKLISTTKSGYRFIQRIWSQYRVRIHYNKGSPIR